MKIMHVSTSSSGGSWVSAHKLAAAQKTSGENSQVITLDELLNQNNQIVKLIRKFLRKINTLFSRISARNEYEFLSIFSVSAGLLPHLKQEKPDIVHIHNWFNILSLKELRKIGEQFPVVFTMHDSRIATGGCHIPYSCSNFTNSCKACPASKFSRNLIVRVKSQTSNSISSISHYAIIAPSKWILSQATQSGVTKNAYKSIVIPNLCPNEIEISDARADLGVIRLLFVAADLSARTKGLQTLIDAASSISLNGSELEINLIGSNAKRADTKPISGVKVIPHGFLSDSETRDLMKNSDLLVVPSTSENFPNVILEAISVGLVVVASSVGGIPEMITHKQNGYLYWGKSNHLATIISDAISSKSEWSGIRSEAQRRMLKDYSNAKTLQTTSELYADLFNSFHEKTIK